MKMEKHLRGTLKAIGYDAVCYTDLFKDGELKYMRYNSVRQKLTDKEIGAVITISLMATEKESVYVKNRESILC